MDEPTITYGLLLRREQPSYGGSPYLIAEIVKREGDHHAPRNVTSSWPWDRALLLDGLAMRGHVTPYDERAFIGHEPEFYHSYAVDLHKAKRMVKTLTRVYAQIAKDDARTATDMFASLCTALKLRFVVECKDDHGRSSYDDNNWHWMTIGQGRNRYRQLIEEMRAEELARKAA